MQRKLSPRQLQILRRIARGDPDKVIAAALGISTRTTAHHVVMLRAKLGASTRAQAVYIGIQLGILTRDSI